MNVGIENIWRNANTIQYDVVFYYADRLLQDNANTNAIYSDGVNVLQSIINLLEEDVDIAYPIQYTPFN